MNRADRVVMIKYRVAQTLAVVSGVFILTVLSVMTATFIGMRTVDPLDSALLSEFRLSAVGETADARLRSEYRSIDLLARRAHFSSLAVYRSGAVLLFCAGVVFILTFKYQAALRARRPDPGRFVGVADMGDPLALSRRTVAVFGLVLLVTAVGVFVVMTPAARDRIAAVRPEPDGGPAGTGQQDIWPGFRGPDGLGIAGDVDPPVQWDGALGKNVRWKVRVPLPGFSSAVVWNGRLFLTGGDAKVREVYCFGTDDGELLWRRAANGIPGSPAVAPEVADDTGHAAATPTTDGRRVYAVFATGDLTALDMHGNRVWARNLGVPRNPYGHASSLLVDDDRLYVQFDDNTGGRMLALNAATGETIWEQRRETLPSWASPIMVRSGGEMQLILNGNPHVVAYDAARGTELWRVDCLGGEVAPSPAWEDGLVFAGNEYVRLVAIAPGGEPRMVWEADHNLPEVSSPVAWRGLLFVATSYGIITCRDAKTGEVRWEQEYDEGFYSSPIVAAGRVYLMNRKGVTHVLRAAGTFELLSLSPLGEKADATPAFVGRRIYLRGEEYLYCLEGQ